MKKGFAKVKYLDPDRAVKAFAKNCKLAVKQGFNQEKEND